MHGRYQLQEELVQVQAERALQLVSMQAYAGRATHTLSGGQKQRVAIAGALAERPQVCPFLSCPSGQVVIRKASGHCWSSSRSPSGLSCTILSHRSFKMLI